MWTFALIRAIPRLVAEWLYRSEPWHATQRRRHAYVPRLQLLENRTVPSVVTVTSALDDGAGGTLRAVLASAHAGDTITFAPALRGDTINLTQGELLIDKSLNLIGPGADRLTISGSDSSRVFEVASGTAATIAGLTISNGLAQMGGGIANEGALALVGDIVSHNTASATGGTMGLSGGMSGMGQMMGCAGGICNMGQLLISGSRITDNVAAAMAGGIGNMGTLAISASAVANNAAGTLGGGICNMGSLFIGQCTFTGNTAGGEGGSIANQSGGTLLLCGSTVNGGALYNAAGGTAILIDSTVSAVANDGTLLIV